MRSAILLPFAFIAAILTSCATGTVDGHRVFGRVHDVSEADIRAALAAEQRESSWADKTIYDVQVLSSTEMYLFHQPSSDNPSHDVAKRVGGKWRIVDTRVILNGR